MLDEQDIHAPHMGLEVAADGMEAELVAGGRPDPSFHLEAVYELLNEHRVVFGIDKPGIERVLREYRDDMAYRQHRGVVARGIPAQPGQDGRIDVLVQEAEKVHFDEDGRADFRNVSRFRTVEKGEVIARLIPPVPGQPGTNVFGEDVEPPEPAKPQIETGPNVSLVPGTNQFVARVKGIFIAGKDRIDINPVLEVTRNVGLESGNINYDGNVRIGGNIERGASVSATGDVEVAGIVESGDIRTGGSLRSRKGFNTRKEKNITVGGNMQATYIDNSAAIVEGDVIAERSIVQSRIICYGNVLLTLAGSTITGGELVAFGNITVGVLGNKTETPTRIWIGTHYKNMEYYKLSVKELEKAERDVARKTELVEKIKVFVQRARGNIPAEKKAEMRIQFREYQEAVALVQRIQDQIRDFAQNRWNKDEVRLVVREVMYPGSEIHYHGNVEKIKAPQTRVVMRFRPDLQKPALEAYKPKGEK